MSIFVNTFAAVLLLFFASCGKRQFNAPDTNAPGFIDLSSISFCSAFAVDDTLMKVYKLMPASNRAIEIIKEIQAYSGIMQEVLIYEGNVPNALATTLSEKRLIIYNEGFMEDADKFSESDYWQSIYLLAHEIGHHLHNHTLQKDSTVRHLQELEADEFAGFLLYRMGASIEQSTWIMNTSMLQGSGRSSTHPPKPKRAEIITKGWQKGFSQAFNIPVPPPPAFDVEDAKDFLSPGFFDCSQLLLDSATYRFFSPMVTGCQLDSMISNGQTPIESDDELLAPLLLRDTLMGVILNLDDVKYSPELGFLEHANARVRIMDYNRKLNPLLSNINIYINDIFCPIPTEGAWNYFTKIFKPGQWIKFKLIVENSTVITPTFRLSYLEFIDSRQKKIDRSLLSPLPLTKK